MYKHLTPQEIEEFTGVYKDTTYGKTPENFDAKKYLDALSFIDTLIGKRVGEIKEKVKARDSKMYEYHRTVFEEGFEGGYPKEWDDFLSPDSPKRNEK